MQRIDTTSLLEVDGKLSFVELGPSVEVTQLRQMIGQPINVPDQTCACPAGSTGGNTKCFPSSHGKAYASSFGDRCEINKQRAANNA